MTLRLVKKAIAHDSFSISEVIPQLTKIKWITRPTEMYRNIKTQIEHFAPTYFIYQDKLTVCLGLRFHFGLPGDLAYEAWKQEKLISAYEARKKLEMMGAMTFSSAARETEPHMYTGAARGAAEQLLRPRSSAFSGN